MSDSRSQSAIAQKFELPERKSKIASLLKQNDQVYCICRSTDSTRLMICCDSCDEWFHADCVKLTKSEAKSIKTYFCPLCSVNNSKLATVFKKKVEIHKKQESKISSSAPTPLKVSHEGNSEAKKNITEEKKGGCGCEGCSKKRNCGKCKNCNLRTGGGGVHKSLKCIYRMCEFDTKTKKLDDEWDKNYEVSNSSSSISSSSSSSSEDEFESISTNRKKSLNKKDKVFKKVSSSAPKLPSVPKKSGKRAYVRRKPLLPPSKVLKYSEDGSGSEEEDKNNKKTPHSNISKRGGVKRGGTQCISPTCINEGRDGSKYCSDECGIRLAHSRLYSILPTRMAEWAYTESVAQRSNLNELGEIQDKLLESELELLKLLRELNCLNDHMVSVRKSEEGDESSEEESEEEGTMFCVTCGVEILNKTCLKHMEKCYNKVEAKTTFGSMYKQTATTGPPLFCDFYNKISETYCKRLRVLCEEHTKPPKVGEHELCGFPLGVLSSGSHVDFCRVRRKKCAKHFSWEKLRRASIDLERVRHYMKMDELLDRDVKVRSAKNSRCGVMGYLLHSTYNHEKFDNLKPQQLKPIKLYKNEQDVVKTLSEILEADEERKRKQLKKK